MYKFLFYKIYCIFKAINEEGWEHIKALIAINALGIMICIDFMIWWIIITKNDINLVFSDVNISITAFTVVIINYRFFLHDQKWKNIVKEFEDNPNYNNKKGNLLAALFVIGIIVSMVLSFYCFSQVEWALYDS
ncbi:hypothetical protein [Hymenobacter elongatus]|uniref:Uncharacterized protein n=1 Tax=Hymenobacter elongatus TaxID=877208 RepID=A0A4Z0PFP8_9BACT|nr:hypothetical protein [Hymenobacter elongatus]TGE13823.1 hypothetical protein E5J99_18895 [Hymenobacter elongatus]